MEREGVVITAAWCLMLHLGSNNKYMNRVIYNKLFYKDTCKCLFECLGMIDICQSGSQYKQFFETERY